MAYLRLNGLVVPVAGGSGDSTFTDVGRVSVGATGAMSQDRVYQKRRWQFKTKPMLMSDLMALRYWLHYPAWVFPFNGNSNSNFPANLGTASNSGLTFPSATAADGLTVTTDAKYGSGCITFPVSTTNVWPDNVITGTDTNSNTTGFTAIAGGVLTSDTAHYWQGSRALKVVASAAGDGFKTNTYAGGGGGWNGSFYVTGTTGVVLTCKLYQATNLLMTKTLSLTAGAWTRFLCEQDKGGTSAAGDVHIEVTAAGAGTWWCDGFELANRNYATQWTASTLSGGSNWSLNTLTGVWGSPFGCSISLWCTRPSIYNGCYQARVWSNAGNPEFGICTSDTWDTIGLFAAENNNGATYRLSAGLTQWTPEWKHFLAVFNKSGHGGPELAIYVDGVLANSATPLLNLDPTTLIFLNVASNNGATACTANVDDVVVFPYPLGPQAALSIAQAGAPMGANWPTMLADGDAMREGPVNVMGALDAIEYAPFVDSTGTFQPTGGTATINLMEA